MQHRIVLTGILSLMAVFTACAEAVPGEQQHNQSQAGQLTQAKPFTVELRFDIKNGEPGLPNEYTKLIFADGSNRYVALVRRSGKVVSEGVLHGATVQEWGFHEVTLGPETNGLGTGYLVITQGSSDILYLKTQLRQITLVGKPGTPHSAFNGLWEVSGATGKFNGLTGAGTLRINRLSESERQWVLEGELSEP
ncbi:hypothetical protein B0G80_2086 [Paraburkholderia sp. BL6669N2]|uniref:hypothetical protein n=1 Tax=Paraburkholderia sp. BL6669N2 TaxID=1938807 RepID=UPI000E23C1FB|nr:hypothetical protein [Paraburkholderia sp. BL6669N2]REG59339.1 hypothetical protein B0G80_2086 [Paraburkholderia sp. BL6669N2]